MNTVTVDVHRCEINKKILAEAWKVMKSFFKGRARDKKENPLWGSAVKLRVRVAVGGQYQDIWVDASAVQEIQVIMKI
jgi:hypothetical protein